MSDFEKLKNMDIQDIHRKTRITLVKLEDILNKNFDNLDVTRARGFIKILERELQLDLQDWLKEYNAHKQIENIQEVSADVQDSAVSSNVQELPSGNATVSVGSKPQESTDNKRSVKNTKQNTQISKSKQHLSSMNIEISMPKQQVAYKTIAIVAVALILSILIILGVYLVGSTTNPQTNNKVVQENDIQKEVVEKDITLRHPSISLSDAMFDKEYEKQGIMQTSEMNLKNQMQINQASEKVETKQTQQQDTKVVEQEMQKVIASEDNQTLKLQNSPKTLVITPKQDVWFAWVDTVTKKRGEKYTKKKPITLTLSNPTVFHFGYAVLTLEIDGQTFEYNQKNVTYMLYDFEEGFKMITQKEYKALGAK